MTKTQKLLDLVMEVAGAPIGTITDRSRISYMAAGLWIAVKGTKMEIDGRMLIEGLYPAFFEDEDERNETEEKENGPDGAVYV